MNDNDFATVRAVASNSVIGGTVGWVVARLRAAFADSWFRQQLVNGGGAWQSWTLEERVRYGAMLIAVAGLVNIGLLALAGSYPAPGIPRAVIGLVVVVAAIVAFAPTAFVAAWPSSGLERGVSTLGRLLQNRDE